MIEPRIFKGDKWNVMLGARIPVGTVVNIVRFYPRRRVMVEYNGEYINTMLWCLGKVHES